MPPGVGPPTFVGEEAPVRSVPPIATALALLSGGLLVWAGYVWAQGHLATALWISIAPAVTIELAFASIRRTGGSTLPLRRRIGQESIALVAGAFMVAAGFAARVWTPFAAIPLVLLGGVTIQAALTLAPDNGVNRGRFTADIDGDFVVFLIGMRFNKPLKIHKWLPVATAMTKMLRTIDEHPELGCLGYRQWTNARTTVMVQYWRDFESLDAFARDRTLPHLEPWRRFIAKLSGSTDVGIWHETYKVRAGDYEAIYGNMPRFGLARAGELVPVGAKGESAAARIGG
jgi:hypothetical protein